MIRPFLAKLTNSEIHAILTGGFATIAGSVMAAYVLIGVRLIQLLLCVSQWEKISTTSNACVIQQNVYEFIKGKMFWSV